jgi:DNA-binding LacI/PurR family transcriptional regulator
VAERRITIRDVAREAGVSVTTVSDGLNGRGRLSLATRTRVQDAARRLGYRPSATARRLRQAGTSIIELYCPLVNFVAGGLSGLDYYMRVVMGATEQALVHDLALTLLPASGAAAALERIDADGVLVVDPVRADPVVSALIDQGLPIVTCERDVTPGVRHAGEVSSDHEGALAKLFDHLRAAGADRIAIITPDRETWWGAALQNGTHAWSDLHDCPVALQEVPTATRERDVEAAAAALLDSTQPPDAIVAAPEQGPVIVLRAARKRGLTVPGDLLLAGCVDTAALAACDPPVTAIDLRPIELGRAGARMLAGVIAGDTPDPSPALIPVDLRIRPSTERAQVARRANRPGAKPSGSL